MCTTVVLSLLAVLIARESQSWRSGVPIDAVLAGAVCREYCLRACGVRVPHRVCVLPGGILGLYVGAPPLIYVDLCAATAVVVVRIL